MAAGFRRGRLIRGAAAAGGAPLLLLVAALAFGGIAWAVSTGRAAGFDRAVLLFLRDPAVPLGPAWLAEVARDITGLGGHAVLSLGTLAVLGFLALGGRGAAAALLAATVAGGMVLSEVLKLGFARPRPDLVPHAVAVYTASFPSGHAMLSAVTYLTLGAMLARVQARRRVRVFILALAGAVTLMVGASRVYLGVHWPTDVLAGWCAGVAWAALCWLAARRSGRLPFR